MPKMRMKNAVVIPRVRVLKRIMCKNSAWCCRGEACLARHRGMLKAAIQWFCLLFVVVCRHRGRVLAAIQKVLRFLPCLSNVLYFAKSVNLCLSVVAFDFCL